jgi:hypothetical protein
METKMFRCLPPFIALVVILFTAQTLTAQRRQVLLKNAIATFSQAGRPVTGAIDGSLSTSGWAIDGVSHTMEACQSMTQRICSQKAVFQIADLRLFASGGLRILTFVLNHNSDSPNHTLGKFRLSVTTAPNPTFTSAWEILAPIRATATFATLHRESDKSIRADAVLNSRDVYRVTFMTRRAGVTGFRLEVLEDPRIPQSKTSGQFNHGPGRADNGNFELTELTVFTEPSRVEINHNPK